MSTDESSFELEQQDGFARLEYTGPHLRRKPLIDYCTNEWRSDPKYASSRSSSDGGEPFEEFYDRIDRCVDNILAVIKAPKFRRLLLSIILLILFSVVLWVKVVGPWIVEERAVRASLNGGAAARAGGLFGTNARPHFPGMIHAADLDPALLPNEAGGRRRLIFIGDIHGCRKELEVLLEKTGFNSETDHLVAVGDVVNKGPDSLGVIDLLRDKKASCVRGNHEDRLLLLAGHAKDTSLRSGKKHGASSSEQTTEEKLARQLSHDQLDYLRSFPLVLRIGNVMGVGDILVVHAGLVPGVPIDNQDPSSIMNMRIIDLKTHVPSKKHKRKNSIPWFKMWNKFQKLLPSPSNWQQSTGEIDSVLSRRTTIVYGHDSKKGLQIGKYTKGLDTGCVNGGKLTALIVSEGGRQELVQVNCQDYTVKANLDDILQG